MSYEQDEALIIAGDESIRGAHYQDTGCHLHPSCLSCPREVCVFDEETEVHTRQPNRGSLEKAVIARQMRNEGKTYPEIAPVLGYMTASAVPKLLKRWEGVA